MSIQQQSPLQLMPELTSRATDTLFHPKLRRVDRREEE